jgi:hypothetical protein
MAGIAVPGRPIGSPGMESGDYGDPYPAFLFCFLGPRVVGWQTYAWDFKGVD